MGPPRLEIFPLVGGRSALRSNVALLEGMADPATRAREIERPAGKDRPSRRSA